MSDDLLSTRSEQTVQQLVGDSVGLLRANRETVSTWLAFLYQRILLGLIILEIPIQLDSYFMHDAAGAKYGAISGYNVSLTTICLILLYIQWLPRHAVESRRFLTSRSLGIYVAMSAMTILWAADRNRTLFDTFLMLQSFAIFIYVVNITKSRKDVMFIMKMLMTGLALQSTFMLLSKLKGGDITFGPIVFYFDNRANRIGSTFGSPNVASSYLAMLIAPGFSVLLLPISKLSKMLVAITLALACFSLVFTLSRGGWVAAAISMMVLCTVGVKQGWFSPTFFFSLLALGVLVCAGSYPVVAARLLQDDDGSAMSRVPLANISQAMIIENPLGVGANNWDIVAKGHAETDQYRAEWFYFVHNKYLLVLAETGWIGLFAFLSFIATTIYSGWQAVKVNSRWLSPLALGLSAGFIGQLVHMVFDVFNSRAQVQLLFLIAATIIAIFYFSKNHRNQVDSTIRLSQTNPAPTGAV